MSTLYLTRNGSPAQGIAALVRSKPDLIIVIPSYNEDDLISTLKSVIASSSTHRIVIIPVINYAEKDSDEIKSKSEQTYSEVINWAVNESIKSIQVSPISIAFPNKKAGVGVARKLGMDEAVRIYEQFDEDGIIVNLDADCIVANNYVSEIIDHFKKNPKSPAASIYFEHLCEDLTKDKAIISYELHLRYFIEMQRYCNLPYAYQTVGSAMATASKAYQKQGGMNKRKAGEDFYFLQKMMLLGNFSEINKTAVYPSSRTSERVPFGTGRAMLEWQQGSTKTENSYHPQSFVILKTFLDILPELFIDRLEQHKGRIPLLVWQFLETMEFHSILMELKKKSTSFPVFQKHFYGWFDGFMLMKYLHFSRDFFYPNQSLTYCIKWLFEKWFNQNPPNDILDGLKKLRESNKKSSYQTGFHSY